MLGPVYARSARRKDLHAPLTFAPDKATLITDMKVLVFRCDPAWFFRSCNRFGKLCELHWSAGIRDRFGINSFKISSVIIMNDACYTSKH